MQTLEKRSKHLRKFFRLSYVPACLQMGARTELEAWFDREEMGGNVGPDARMCEDRADAIEPTYDVSQCFLSAVERSDFGMWQQQQLERDRHRVWCERFCDDPAEQDLEVQPDWSVLWFFSGPEPH